MFLDCGPNHSRKMRRLTAQGPRMDGGELPIMVPNKTESAFTQLIGMFLERKREDELNGHSTILG